MLWAVGGFIRRKHVHGEKAGDLWREMGSDLSTPGREAQWTAAVDPPTDNSFLLFYVNLFNDGYRKSEIYF